MKKKVLLLGLLFLLSGCGKEKIVCKYQDKSLNYKNERTLVLSYEDDVMYSFKSIIEEEYPDEEGANNSYINYQTLYNNYNENNVISEYKKDGKKVTVIYNIDLRDIENQKIEFEFDFTDSKEELIKSLEDLGYKCK